ncbi:hypothetical protein H4R19_001047 [Coemansia spiralis]|nr:hypothetical protein H4R19_001047 [Coemansia spiralis]
MRAEGGPAHADDAVLATLRRAQQYAQSSNERVKVQLAAELRGHYLSERGRHGARRQQVQRALADAQAQYKAGARSRAADMERLKQLSESSALTQRLVGSGRRVAVQEALQFSEMMMETAKTAIDARRQELADVDALFAGTVACLQKESAGALLACQHVLARMPADASRCAAAPVARLPLPPPPPPPVPPLRPVPAAGPAPARRVPPIQPLPRPPAQPLPRLPPIAAGIRPRLPERTVSLATSSRLTIEHEDQQQSAAVEAQLRRFQAQVPVQLLGALRVRMARGSEGEDAEYVGRLVFGQLWPGLRTVLELCLPDIGRADLAHGQAGFGADAYLELFGPRQQQQQQRGGNLLVRVPVSTIGMRFGPAADGMVAVPQRLTKNQQSIMDAFGPKLPVAQAVGAEAAVGRLVQLVAAEPMARNAGVLATPMGLLFVRRTAVQCVLISRLHCYSRSTAPAAWWCHPAAALACFAAELLAAGPVPTLEPPQLLHPLPHMTSL